MKRSAALALALTLGGCASLGSNPEYTSLYKAKFPDIADISSNDSPNLAAQVNHSAKVGNLYKSIAVDLADEDKLGGGLTLTSAFYGGAVTAFNPAPKNLLAALLATGTSQAWRSSLRPGERAQIYMLGYHGMSCVRDTAEPLASRTDHAKLSQLLDTTNNYLDRADAARFDALTQSNTDPVQLQKLLALIERLNKAQAAIRLEQASATEAPYRVAQVRRQIEKDIDRRLAAAAPDYDSAVKLLSQSATPQPGNEGNTNPQIAQGTEKTNLHDFVAAKPPLEHIVIDLERKVERLGSSIPTTSTDTYKRLGECAVKSE